MATYNNLIAERFVKETRTDGVVTSLTIKMVAYDGDNNFTTITGDNSYLTGNDSTWQWKTVTDTTYHDYDNCKYSVWPPQAAPRTIYGFACSYARNGFELI